MEFSSWISKKYNKWRRRVFWRKRSVSEYADYIGVSQSLMSQWMTPASNGGIVPTDLDTIANIAEKCGFEAYAVLGILPPILPSNILFDEETRSKYAMLSDEAKWRIQRQIRLELELQHELSTKNER